MIESSHDLHAADQQQERMWLKKYTSSANNSLQYYQGSLF